jgi:hypothetical protein
MDGLFRKEHRAFQYFILGIAIGSLVGGLIGGIEYGSHLLFPFIPFAWGGLIGGIFGCGYGFVRQWVWVRKQSEDVVTTLVDKETQLFLFTFWIPLMIFIPHILWRFSGVPVDASDIAAWCWLCAGLTDIWQRMVILGVLCGGY